MDFFMTWGTAFGIFLLTGSIMEALNRSIGAKAGDPGFKGVWYVWRRVAITLTGMALGAVAFSAGMSTPLGDGMGYGVLNGGVAAGLANSSYETFIGSFKAWLKHKLAKLARKPKNPDEPQ